MIVAYFLNLHIWPEFTVRPKVGGQAEATDQVDFPVVLQPGYISSLQVRGVLMLSLRHHLVKQIVKEFFRTEVSQGDMTALSYVETMVSCTLKNALDLTTMTMTNHVTSVQTVTTV